MLVAHAADLHLGRFLRSAERRGDFLDAFWELVDKVLEAKPRLLILAGDIFDAPRPPTREILEALRGVGRLTSEGIEVLAIAGNHDRVAHAGDVSPVELLREAGAKVLRWREELEIEGVQFLGGPYVPNEKLLSELLEEAASRAKKPSVLVLHQGLSGIVPQGKLHITDELLNAFTYIALGHYHKPKDWGRFAYPGSTEHYDASEAGDPKGFYLFDLERPEEKEFVQLERVRPHLRVRARFKELAEALEGLELAGEKAPVLILEVTGVPREVSHEQVEGVLLRSGVLERVLDYSLRLEYEEEEAEEEHLALRENPLEAALKDKPPILLKLARAMEEAGHELGEEATRERVREAMVERGREFLENEAPPA